MSKPINNLFELDVELEVPMLNEYKVGKCQAVKL